MPLNLLYLADPNSMHDVKWMTYFSSKHNCHCVCRKQHLLDWSLKKRQAWEGDNAINIAGTLDDFSVRHPLATWHNILKLGRFLRDLKIDLFHILYTDPNLLWANFRQGPARWLATTRGTDILRGIPNFRARKDLLGRFVFWLYRRAAAKVDGFTGTSQSQIESLNRLFGKSVHALCIRTGVDFGHNAQQSEFYLPSDLTDHPFLLFPRAMEPQYRHDFAIEMIGRLSHEVQQHFHFVFLYADGPNSEYISTCRRLMDENHVARFVFLPRQDAPRLNALYKAACLTVMTPVSDGTPVSAIEALYWGCPVVAVDLPYDSDLRSWLVIAPQDIEGLTRQVESSLRLPRVLIDNQFLKKFDSQQNMACLEAHYHALLERDRRSNFLVRH